MLLHLTYLVVFFLKIFSKRTARLTFPHAITRVMCTWACIFLVFVKNQTRSTSSDKRHLQPITTYYFKKKRLDNIKPKMYFLKIKFYITIWIGYVSAKLFSFGSHELLFSFVQYYTTTIRIHVQIQCSNTIHEEYRRCIVKVYTFFNFFSWTPLNTRFWVVRSWICQMRYSVIKKGRQSRDGYLHFSK